MFEGVGVGWGGGVGEVGGVEGALGGYDDEKGTSTTSSAVDASSTNRGSSFGEPRVYFRIMPYSYHIYDAMIRPLFAAYYYDVKWVQRG